MAKTAKVKRRLLPKPSSKKIREQGPERRSTVVDRLAGKAAKSDVEYRPSHKDTKSSCAECEHYLNPGQEHSSCRRVAGAVAANDVCDLFVARNRER